MLIVCPNCATSYQVEPSSLGATGRSVRCVRCQKVWFAANTERDGGDRPLPPARTWPPLSAGAPIRRRPEPPVTSRADGRPLAEADRRSRPSAAEASTRDDRGPAPLPEPRDYDLPRRRRCVDDAPALAPGDHDGAAAQPRSTPSAEDIETVAARRIRAAAAAARKSRWPIAAAGRPRSCC